MPPRTGHLGRNDALYAQIQRRMIESGEWDRISIILTHKLNESGWLDDIRHKGKEKARDMDPLSFEELMTALRPHAESSLPTYIKDNVMGTIRQFLEKQVEA